MNVLWTSHASVFLCPAGFAINAALAFERQLAQMFGPLISLSVIIRFNPDYAAVNATFDKVAKELLDLVRGKLFEPSLLSLPYKCLRPSHSVTVCL